MAEWLAKLDPSPSEARQIAARAQHIRRWMVPREDYPAGREGYLRWRTFLYRFHSDQVEAILREVGYDGETIALVRKMVGKQGMKRDLDVQLLEDVACLVFLEYYFPEFAKKNDEQKLVDIVRKTWKKMSEVGHNAALTLHLPDELAGVVGKALELAEEKSDAEKAAVCADLNGQEKSQAKRQHESTRSVTKMDRPSLTRYAWLSIAAAIITIALKTWAWRITGSVGLLSDAMESMVNLVAAIMALAMLTLAAQPPDDQHHFGHGKAEYFSSGLEGALILVAALGIGMAAYERLLHPLPLQSLDLGLVISTIAALVNLDVALVLLRVGRSQGSITLEADGKHLMTDVWTSVGVLLALGGVWVTGWQQLDPIIGFVVAINIIWSGFTLMSRSAAGLLDSTLPEEENARIDDILDHYRREGIEFHDLRTRQSGADRFMTVHVLVPGVMTVKSGHDLMDRIENDIRQAIGEISVVTHLEPLEDPASFNHGETGYNHHPGRESLSPAPVSRRNGLSRAKRR